MTVNGLSEGNKRDFSIVLVYLLLAQTLSNVRYDIALKRAPVQQTVRHIHDIELLTNDKWSANFENEAGKLLFHLQGSDALPTTSSFDTSLDAFWNELSALSLPRRSYSGSERDEQRRNSRRIAYRGYAQDQLGDGDASVALLAAMRDLDKFSTGRVKLPSAMKIDRNGIGRTRLEERGTLDSKSQRQFDVLSPNARALLHAHWSAGVSVKDIAKMVEPTRIFLRPLWYEQVSAADFAESNVLIRKADPLMTAAASHFASGSACAPGSYDAACASKTDESTLLAGIDHWDGEYDVSNADGFSGKPLAFGNYSDANANQLHYDAANRDASPACSDGISQPTPGELVDIIEDSDENVDSLGTRIDAGTNRFGSASNSWQATTGYREHKDQPQSGEYLLAYEPGATSSSWRAPSNELEYIAEENYPDAGEMVTVNEEFGTSNDNLLTILTDIEQSVNELNELEGEEDQRRFESAAYAFIGRPVRRASDESGVRSLSNEDEEEQQLEIEFDPDLNVFNEVTPHPEYAEVANWPNPSYLPYASTSSGYPSLSTLPRLGLRNRFEETEEEECELEESEEDVSNVDDASLYTVPKSRAQHRPINFMRSRNQPTTSDATDSIASWNDQDPSEHSYEHSDTNSRATSSAQLGSHALSNANLPFGDDEIVHSSFAHFESMLTDPRLSPSDVQTMKDIRRRGKNKIAAMNCRRRKQHRVDTLIDERVELNRQNRALEGRLARLREQARAYDARLERAMRQHQSNGAQTVAVRA